MTTLATFSCLSGYYLSEGATSARCANTGSWTATFPECIQGNKSKCLSHSSRENIFQRDCINLFITFPFITKTKIIISILHVLYETLL